jgi:hypothetical protein
MRVCFLMSLQITGDALMAVAVQYSCKGGQAHRSRPKEKDPQAQCFQLLAARTNSKSTEVRRKSRKSVLSTEESGLFRRTRCDQSIKAQAAACRLLQRTPPLVLGIALACIHRLVSMAPRAGVGYLHLYYRRYRLLSLIPAALAEVGY